MGPATQCGQSCLGGGEARKRIPCCRDASKATRYWQATESTDSNQYWVYDKYEEAAGISTSAGWEYGSIGSGVAFRVTQGAHLGFDDTAQYTTFNCWFAPPYYTDQGTSGWLYFDST